MANQSHNQPKEGSNKNEYFNDKLCVGNMPPMFYYEEYLPWERAKRISPVLNHIYKKP